MKSNRLDNSSALIRCAVLVSLFCSLVVLGGCGGGGGAASTSTDAAPAPSSAADAYWVVRFDFRSTQSYALRCFATDGTADSTGAVTYFDKRYTLANGVPLDSSQLYDTALFASPQGWSAVNGNTPDTSTPDTVALAASASNPSQSSTFDDGFGYVYTETNEDIDVSGQSLASVAAQAQDSAVNSSPTLLGFDPSQLTGSMPSGSKIRKVTSVGLDTPVGYRVSDGTVGSASVQSLSDLVAAFPVPVAPTALNTVSMGTIYGINGCHVAACARYGLRVAFDSSGAAAYFMCAIDAATSEQSNCTAAANGSYRVGTAADAVTPIMTFAGLPSAANGQSFTRVFVARQGAVYYGWKDKPVDSTQTRLNKAAFEAIVAALGIDPNSIGRTSSIY